MVTTRWHDKQFEKEVLDPAIVQWLRQIALRGELIAKRLITTAGPLFAVKTGHLASTLTHEVDVARQIARIGTNVEYAIHVFLGTVFMKARPILRTMLMMLRAELK